MGRKKQGVVKVTLNLRAGDPEALSAIFAGRPYGPLIRQIISAFIDKHNALSTPVPTVAPEEIIDERDC